MIAILLFLCGNLTAIAQDVTIGISGRGAISVTDNVSGSAVFLDGQPTGKFTPVTLTNVSQGSHVVALSKQGYAVSPSKMSLMVAAGKTAVAQFTLSFASTGGGTSLLPPPSLTSPLNANTHSSPGALSRMR
ncbi:MAG: PEGA domain-containing protein [Armatimonadetes bacterium]|nr:PEGA domain-containing protein [Armatimonadota bacterium]